MQFGRLHGIALAVLGLLLISVQVVFAFAGRTDINPAAHPESSAVTAQQSQQSHHFGPLAGIIGAASLVTGLAIFATARRRDEPEPQHAVK
jgi:Na+-transporting methylmalonyl-CoA/oxaloacetate decarboxylase gamma subunit